MTHKIKMRHPMGLRRPVTTSDFQVCRDSLIWCMCVPWLIHTCVTYLFVCYDSFYMRQLLRLFGCALTLWNVCHDSFIRVPWLIHTCAMTHSYVCHDSFIRVSSHMHVHVTWIISYTLTTSLIHMCHDSFIRVPWRIRVCAMTHLCTLSTSIIQVCHDTFMCGPWLHYMCAMTHTNVHWLHWSFGCAMTRNLFACVPWLIHMCSMTHTSYACAILSLYYRFARLHFLFSTNAKGVVNLSCDNDMHLVKDKSLSHSHARLHYLCVIRWQRAWCISLIIMTCILSLHMHARLNFFRVIRRKRHDESLCSHRLSLALRQGVGV